MNIAHAITRAIDTMNLIVKLKLIRRLALITFCAMPVVALYRINTAVSRGMKVMRHDIFSRGITETIVTTLAFLAALWLGLRTFAPEIAVIVGMGASGIVALLLVAGYFLRSGEDGPALATLRR